MNDELLNVELLAFMKYLESHHLSVCITGNGGGFWPISWSSEDLVAAYMNVKTGGKR